MVTQNEDIAAKLSTKRKFLLYYTRFIFVIKFALLLFLCILSFTNFLQPLTNKLKNWACDMTASQGLVLEKIVIENQKYISSPELYQILNLNKGDALLSVNIQELKKRLEESQWIKSAIVQKQWPNSIHIALLERVPVAIWQFQNKLYLIDEDGNRLANYDDNSNDAGFGKMLHVVGQDANIYAKQLLQDLSHYPELAKKVSAAVRYGQRRWNLHLQQAITVKMPENDFLVAYKYLYDLDRNHKLFYQAYKILDLRNQEKYFFERYQNPES